MKNNLRFFEDKYYRLGYKVLVGIDEAGRGSWAGPIVVAACVFPKEYFNPKINDSKTLSIKLRSELYNQILKDCIDYSIVFVDPSEVDKLNPKQATINAMKKCLTLLNKCKPDLALIDAEKIDSKIETKSIINGDAKSISIAAASIIAKVTRDNYMINISNQYPEFYFHKHKGYGTMLHLKAINKNGVIKDFHRLSYKPINKLSEKNNFYK